MKLILTVAEARQLIDGELEDYEVIKDDVDSRERWSVVYDLIFKRKSDGKYFRGYYQRGATEYQEERPFENTEPEFFEVLPKDKVVTVYEYVKDNLPS